MSRATIHVTAHPPERGQRRDVVLCSPGCCCCCCLHAAGGVLGAALGSVRAARANSEPPSDSFPDASDRFLRRDPPLSEEHVTEGPNPSVVSLGSEQVSSTVPLETPRRLDPPTRDFHNSEGTGSLSGPALYWLTLLGLTLFACVGAAFYFSGTGRNDVLLGILFVLFLAMPAVQLAASALSALLVFLWYPDDRPSRWRAIATITVWSVVGTLVGLVLTPCCLMHR